MEKSNFLFLIKVLSLECSLSNFLVRKLLVYFSRVTPYLMFLAVFVKDLLALLLSTKASLKPRMTFKHVMFTIH